MALLCANTAVAQVLSPSGYTGAINTPTALTLKPASMGMALSNSIPEFHELYPGTGAMLSMNLGFGLFEGFEMVGRLTNNGDLNCDTYLSSCQTSTRDLSVGGKYQLPLERLLGAVGIRDPYVKPAIAVGVTDYGGAATLYRQQYMVGSLSADRLLLSGGYSYPQASSLGGGLMRGAFGSAIFKVTEQLSVAAESDSREKRAGLSWTSRLSANMDVVLAASKKVTHNTAQQASQMSVGLVYHFGRGDRESSSQILDTRQWPIHPAQQAPTQQANMPAALAAPAAANALPVAQPSVATRVSDPEKAQVLAEQFGKNGFSNVDVAKTPSGWIVRAEPRQWRQNRLDAYGAALASYLQAGGQVDISEAMNLGVALTFMGQVVGAMSVGGPFSAVACIRQYLGGSDLCSGTQALVFHYTQESLPEFQHAQWMVNAAHSAQFMPQFEISPAASYTAGTEFGLLDYSLGATMGWEVPLAKGLFWQGFTARLITQTDDFKNPDSYFRRVGMGEATRPGANLLVYQQRLLPQLSPRLWGQVSVGNLGYKTSGQQFNGYWASEDGKYRTTWIRGQWRNPDMPQVREPNIWSLGWRPFSSDFQLTYSAGRFHNNDTGSRLGASFSFDDYGLQFYWRKTGPSDILPNRNAYLGFALTLPLGPKRALSVGPTTWRFRDRWEVGMETKIAQKDNYIEPFYGAFPGIRHSLDTDVFDFNRNDISLSQLNAYRVRVTAREVYLSESKK